MGKNEKNLVSILIKVNFKRNKEIIYKLATLPNLKECKDYILKLANEIQNTDFSFLSDIQREKVDEEKTKIYQEIIIKCK